MFKFHSFLALAVACVGCGASFTASDGSGSFGGSGQAGEASGGLTGSAGSPSVGDAGAMDVGGSSSAGQAATAGAGGSTTGHAGSGTGGQGAGGGWSGSGGNPGADCSKLKEEYTTAVAKARVCDKGSTDECSAASVAKPIGGCGCAVLVNAKSEYTATANQAYQAYQDAKCGPDGVICNIFCPSPASASCAQQAMASGNTFVCSAGIAVQN